MFGPKERVRLLSEPFAGDKGSSRLAQILSTMMDPDIPVELRAPLTLNVPQGVAPINIPNRNFGDIIFNITDSNGAVTGTVVFGTNGLESRDANGIPFPVVDGGGTDERVEFVGTVQSGTGATYQVLLDTGDTVTAVQQQINVGQTIPAGTSTSVILDEGVYKMQVAVFV